jgi:hypothetical protein
MVALSKALAMLDGEHAVKSGVAAKVLDYATTKSIRDMVKAGKLETVKVGRRQFITCESIIKNLKS